MDATERQARAEQAERLINDKLLIEAFDKFEQALLDRALQAPARDDEGRKLALQGVQVCRKVRSHLDAVIKEGKIAAINAAKDIAPAPPTQWTGPYVAPQRRANHR